MVYILYIHSLLTLIINIYAVYITMIVTSKQISLMCIFYIHMTVYISFNEFVGEGRVRYICPLYIM